MVKLIKYFFINLYSFIKELSKSHPCNWGPISRNIVDSQIDLLSRISSPCNFSYVSIGKGTYIGRNSTISKTNIGKFCSIGPNFFCGWGIHPLNGISTSPVFYSTKRQASFTLCEKDKIIERKPIVIGNDVFIGSNVIVLDGVSIGDGAVIGAGAVVSKDIPPYAIAVGSPIKIIKYRFSESIIKELLMIKWWDFSEEDLKDVEECFFDIEEFINKHNERDYPSIL